MVLELDGACQAETAICGSLFLGEKGPVHGIDLEALYACPDESLDVFMRLLPFSTSSLLAVSQSHRSTVKPSYFRSDIFRPSIQRSIWAAGSYVPFLYSTLPYAARTLVPVFRYLMWRASSTIGR